MVADDFIHYRYSFTWPDGREVGIAIGLHRQTLDAPAPARAPETAPDWVRLDTCQCPNCPLSVDTHPLCPVAQRVEPLLTQFADATSYEAVHVRVDTEQRSYSADTTLQQGVSSMLGVVMATSGCPVLDPLRPMARFHLPFASYEETAYRALSMYLLAQHVRAQQGMTPDWPLDGYVAMYQAIQQVNAAFARRLRQFITNDANANALVILDCFAAMTAMDVDMRRSIPASLEAMFSPWLEQAPH